MSYNFSSYNDIGNMDYLSLVKMLMDQITVEKRKEILQRLTEMNNQLLMGYDQSYQSEPPRIGFSSSRKKDLSENMHPSFDQYSYKGQNPLPFGLPLNSTVGSDFDFRSTFSQNYNNPIPKNSLNNALINNTLINNAPIQNTLDQINIDEIISDIHGESNVESLDKKLAKIKNLQDKIIIDKRKRKKKEQEQKYQL